MSDDINDLRARVEAIEALPYIQVLLDEQRQKALAAQHARERAEEDKARREREDAALRARVEKNPMLRITVAPDARDVDGRPVRCVLTTGKFYVAVKGDRFAGGVVIVHGEEVQNEHMMPQSEWDHLLHGDEELRAHVDAGHLAVDRVPFDEVARDARSGAGSIARWYR